MSQPFLSITIPTYNRLHYLRETLTILFSTAEDDVEIIVSDNCSTDGTWEYLQSISHLIKVHRQEVNVGHDGNLLKCLELATGTYVWTLSDDDRPCANWLEHLRRGIAEHDAVPLLFMKTFCADAQMTKARSRMIPYRGWQEHDPNGFLRAIGYWVGLGSSVVVRRECIDLSFLRRWLGTNVMPAVLILSTVCRHGRALVSKATLLAYRPGNSGGYDGVRAFSHNIRRLFAEMRRQGLRRAVTNYVYNDILTNQINYFILYSERFPFTLRGCATLFRCGFAYRSFYTCVIPVMAYKFCNSTFLLKRSPMRVILDAMPDDALRALDEGWAS